MTTPRDTDSWLRGWMSDAAGEPATGDLLERFEVEIGQRRPRPAWLARVHDRIAHGRNPWAGRKERFGVLAITAVTLLTLVGLFGQLVPGGSADRKGLGPAIPSPSPSASPAAPASASSRPVTTPSVQPSVEAADIGSSCRSDAPATLPTGPLPVTLRPSVLPVNDGYLAIGPPAAGSGPVLLDPTTSTRRAILIASGGKPVSGDLFVLPGWSPDGRWLAVRWGSDGQPCGDELIVSADGTHAVDVTDYPPGRSVLDAAWSPDGRWLAVISGERIDVFGVAPDGTVGNARTVWQAPVKEAIAFGPAWGPDGTLAFQLESQTATTGDGGTVALLGPGESAPRLVHVTADILAPLAWTTDGSAIIARGDVGDSDVGMFRITPQGDTRIPLPGIRIHGGKWLDVPEAIVGDRIVFAGYTDPSAPDLESIYTMMADGSDLTKLPKLAAETGVTFAPAPDGRHVALSSGNTIWVVDVTDGSKRTIIGGGGGIMDWQPLP